MKRTKEMRSKWRKLMLSARLLVGCTNPLFPWCPLDKIYGALNGCVRIVRTPFLIFKTGRTTTDDLDRAVRTLQISALPLVWSPLSAILVSHDFKVITVVRDRTTEANKD